MLIDLTLPATTTAVYPDLTELNPKKKNKAWVMQYGRAFISQYLQSHSRDFYNGRASGRYPLAEKYANGTQPVKAVLLDENGNPDTTGKYSDLHRPLKLLKKSLRAVDGKLKDHNFTATVTPIDATAQDEKYAYEDAMRTRMEHGEFIKSLGLSPPSGQPGGATTPDSDVPVDEDELQLHMEIKYRHRDAMLLEMKLALGLYMADYDQINRQCLRDETTYGSSIIFMALRGPRRLPQRIEPGYGIFLPSSTENYANLQAGAHIEKITLGALLKEVEADPDTTFSAADLDRLTNLARQSIGRPGSGYYYNDTLGGVPEMAGQLEVIRFSFKTRDAVVMKEYTNKFGNPQVREKPAGYQDSGTTPGKVHRQTIGSWYEGTLIMGTDLGYGCQKAYEQLRDEDNPFDCHPLYIVTSPDMLGGYTESVVEQCMLLVDTACDAFARLRYKQATSRGSWLEFDIDAIEDMALTKANGTKMTTHETIANFFRNGYIAGRKRGDGSAEGKVGAIVTSGHMAVAEEIAEQWNTIAQCRQEIEAVTGINGSISADDPASRQGVGVTQMAISSAENTLDYLYVAKQNRFERVVRAMAVSLKQSEGRAPLTGPVPPGYDGGGCDMVGTSPTLASRVMQTKIERKPTQDEWKRLYGQVDIMLKQQQIEPEDAIFIEGIDNLKQAGAMLGVRAKRKRMQASQSAQQQTSMASQQQMESAKATAEEARKTMQLEYDLKMALEELKGRNAVAAAQVRGQGHLDAADLLGMYKLQQQQSAQAHQAEQSAQGHDVGLAKQSAQLDSQEQMQANQQGHEAQMAQNEQQAQQAQAEQGAAA